MEFILPAKIKLKRGGYKECVISIKTGVGGYVETIKPIDRTIGSLQDVPIPELPPEVFKG